MTSSPLYSRLQRIFNESSAAAVVKTSNAQSRSKPRNPRFKRKQSSGLSTSAASGEGGKSSIDIEEKKLKKRVEKFKKSCESESFRRAHGIYGAFIRRLAALRKHSMIDDVLQYQKKFEDIKSESFVIRMMLLYGYAGMAEHARKLFDEMPQLNCERTIKSLNALLSAYVESRKFDEVVQVLEEMPEKLGINPDLVSYNTMIKAFCKRGSLNDALSMFSELEKNLLEPNLITFNTMFEAFYRKGWFSEADKLWNLMESKNLVPDIRSYNSRIRGLVLHQKFEDAITLIDGMKASGTFPDIHTFNALIAAYRNDDQLDEAMRWYKELEERGLRPDSVTYCVIIPLLCKKGDLDMAVKVSKGAIGNEVLSRPNMFKPVIEGLVDGGKVDEAMELVKEGKLRSYFRYHPGLPISDHKGDEGSIQDASL